jgi:hypothetical protein
MLSFNNLGNLGRIGNQMFQYASLKGIAHNRGFEFSIPPKEIFGIYDINVKNSDSNIYNLFNLDVKNTIKLTENTTFNERFFHYDDLLFNTCPDNIDLCGYFQNPKYFENIKDEIIKDFKFPDELKSECMQFFDNNFDGDAISLHIRRGDYLKYSQHPVQTLEYYEKSLSLLPENVPVIIFSSDDLWCKEQDLFQSDRFFISENNTTEFDLCLMHLCNYHIIANSSFSWWGSWLSNSKKTIAPKNWFSGSNSNYKVEGLYLKDWVIL